MNPPPGNVAVVGLIEIALTREGKIFIKANFPGGRPTGLMMLEEAKQQLLEELKKKQDGPAIVIAPPGLRVAPPGGAS